MKGRGWPRRIAVLGAGAMGSLFGGHLARAGFDVCLISRDAAHVQAIRRDGLRVRDDDGEWICRPDAVTTVAACDPADLVLVLVKSLDTAPVAAGARALLAEGGVALTLQNGMGNAEVLAATCGPARVFAGVTAHGAHLLGPGRVRHAARGETHLGEAFPPRPTAVSARAEAIAAAFSAAGLPAAAVQDIRPYQWRKLFGNVGINALTAILGVPNGEVAANPHLRAVLAAAVEEAAAVARAAGVELPPGDPVEHALNLARATAANRSSMLQDVTRGRPTEIAAINGHVVALGRQVGVATPVNELLLGLVAARTEASRAGDAHAALR